MSDVAEVDPTGGAGRSRKKLIILALPIVAAGLGVGLGYVGGWSPRDILSGREANQIAVDQEFIFIDLPQMVMLISGNDRRNLVVSIKIEAAPDQAKNIAYLQPRIMDSFNTFLTGIDAAAFEKRGILDVIRAELSTRLSFILGPEGFSDVLITEFRIQ